MYHTILCTEHQIVVCMTNFYSIVSYLATVVHTYRGFLVLKFWQVPS